MLVVKQVIDKKRQGGELTSDEIRETVSLYSKGAIPDYQMSALAMAICCKGMNARETSDLTCAMMRSGETIEWDVPTADKHSTGGVGDKFSLVIQPLAASCGLYVPSMTGRGLGHTGGTADKLESIPGYNAGLSIAEMKKVVLEAGLAMTCQTAEICPADKKLYALRDVTGTVASIPLITGSILSKKLAEGSHTLVFDVKCGRGAFMQTLDEAVALAKSLVDGAKLSGRKAAALVTRMDNPLGATVGNANEVEESLDILQGNVTPLTEGITALCIEEAALMVALEKGISREEAREMCKAKLASGEAYGKFKAMASAQGGDLEAFAERRANAHVTRFRISALKSGFIHDIDAMAVANAALELGAGRKVAGEAIDHDAGIELAVKTGDKVTTGAPLATLSTATKPDSLEKAAAMLMDAFRIDAGVPDEKPLILEMIL
ncbi:MAG: thymidine phosphorylase [Kiritimatiellae bacterium]|nr:thymidine phosphorylase [Kiritimatiellia bacterium]